MRIEECIPCPRCGQRRVVQHSRTAFLCFQCRHGWSTGPEGPRAHHNPADEDDVLGMFPPHHRARLIAYRGAIRAGLFSDWPRTRTWLLKSVRLLRSSDFLVGLEVVAGDDGLAEGAVGLLGFEGEAQGGEVEADLL